MNTDAILDFVVDYYIWFVIGGSILLFAVIGFIADKKKIFSKKNNNKDINKSLENEETKTIDSDIPTIDNNIEKDMISNKYEEEKTVDNKLSVSNMDASENLKEIDEYENDEQDKENLELDSTIDDSNNLIAENNEELSEIDEKQYNDVDNEIETVVNVPENTADKEENININDSSDVEKELQYIDSLDTENSKIIDSDIQNDLEYIDDLSISDGLKEHYNQDVSEKIETNSIDDSFNIKENEKNVDDVEVVDIKNNEYDSKDKYKEEEIINLNDKDDEPLNVSYSKLREMVEEIIAENEKKDDNNKTIELNEKEKTDSIGNNLEKSISPNLDQNAVEKIKQLDEDEDDVWKF